jgi:hypothetical protein
MGLNYYTAREVLRGRVGATLGAVATIGRLQQFLLADQIAALRAAHDLPADGWAEQPFGGSADGFFRAAGASEISAIDASDYEGAAILHDMNVAIGPELERLFDLVVDGGSIEHIFRPDRALANVMRMTKVGGRVLIWAPANNQCGHGFYQFSPEFFFSSLHEGTGFKIDRVLLVECVYPSVSLVAPRRAYVVRSPREVRERVGVVSRRPLMLLVNAIKRAHVDDPFAVPPQQSDYEAQWSDRADARSSRLAGFASAAAVIARRHPLGAAVAHHALGQSERRRFSLRNRSFFEPDRD